MLPFIFHLVLSLICKYHSDWMNRYFGLYECLVYREQSSSFLRFSSFLICKDHHLPNSDVRVYEPPKDMAFIPTTISGRDIRLNMTSQARNHLL